MLRRLLTRWLPEPRKIRSEYGLGVFGRLLDDRDLWRLGRRSTARAAAVGIFCSMMPFPFQMVIAAAVSIAVGCNVPIAVVMCWITNPITIAPIYIAAYRLGAWLLGLPPRAVRFEISLDWVMGTVSDVWLPLTLGCVVIGASGAILGFYGTHLIWRASVVREWRGRRRGRSGRGAIRSLPDALPRAAAFDPPDPPDPDRGSPPPGSPPLHG